MCIRMRYLLCLAKKAAEEKGLDQYLASVLTFSRGGQLHKYGGQLRHELKGGGVNQGIVWQNK